MSVPPSANVPSDKDAIARKMVAEDARGAASVVLFNEQTNGAITSLLFFGHIALIVYEGALFVRAQPLEPALPMNGIVEALPDGRPFTEYQADLVTVLDECSDLWHAWRS